MTEKKESRFDAERVGRLATVNRKTRRVEVEFEDSDHQHHVVSLPVEAAVALGRLICDLSDGTPFMKCQGDSNKKDA